MGKKRRKARPSERPEVAERVEANAAVEEELAVCGEIYGPDAFRLLADGLGCAVRVTPSAGDAAMAVDLEARCARCQCASWHVRCAALTLFPGSRAPGCR